MSEMLVFPRGSAAVEPLYFESAIANVVTFLSFHLTSSKNKTLRCSHLLEMEV